MTKILNLKAHYRFYQGALAESWSNDVNYWHNPLGPAFVNYHKNGLKNVTDNWQHGYFKKTSRPFISKKQLLPKVFQLHKRKNQFYSLDKDDV